MYELLTQNNSTFVVVTTEYNDKTYRNKYKVNPSVDVNDLTMWLDGQNPEFLNKNIKDNLIPNSIVTDAGNAGLIQKMIEQVNG